MDAMGVTQLVLTLAATVGLILFAGWAAKRMLQPQGNGGQLRVVCGLSLGSREKLMVIELDGEQMLIGVTASQITPIKTMERPLAPEQRADFAAMLKSRFVQQDRG